MAAWLVLLTLAACGQPPDLSSPGETLAIAVPGTAEPITARLCRPAVAGPVPLAVINHGSPVAAADRTAMRPFPCDAEAVRWFTARGFAVLLPLRRGYGESRAAWAEGYGRCEDADFARAGRETARDIAAAVAHATRLPGIRPTGVLVVGQSAGGFGALALSADNPPQVAALVSMAGGRGGWAQGVPNTNCRPDRLAEAAAEYGRTARLPTLWIYTANDSFFAPALASAMHRAYIAAGGSAALASLPAYGGDGHSQFFGPGGSARWGPVVEPFLRTHGYGTR